MSANPASVRLTPDWLAHRYDPTHDAVHFVQVDRLTRHSATFLTDQYLPTDLKPLVLRRQDALANAVAPAPIHFIFHSAFCCSTLLAVAMDREAIATGFKEPVILNDLVGWRRRSAPAPRLAEALDSAMSLLARPFEAGEAAIIKPSNVINGLAPGMLAMRPNARAILLYAPLRVFLTSIAKKGLDGRLWARELFLGLRADGLVQRLGFDDKAFFGQTDLQIAAAGWLAQQALFADIIGSKAGPRVRSMSSEALLSNPKASVEAAAKHFALRLTSEDVAEIVAGPFQRNAKSGDAFGKGEREQEHRSAAAAHADEIEKVAVWAEAVAATAAIPLELSAALN
jgi:hypothetical protein